jgi:hypothetical protein
MPELLLFSWDHATKSAPTPSAAQLAALPKLGDLVAWRPDGWNWGKEELGNPWFRVLAWPAAAAGDLDALLSPLLPAIDSNMQPTTYWQYRGFYLDLTKAMVPVAVKTWWTDEMRTIRRLARLVPSPGMTIAALKTARPPVAIPV